MGLTWHRERGRLLAIALRIAVVLLLPYYVYTNTSNLLGTRNLEFSSLVWTFVYRPDSSWNLSVPSYDILAVFQIALVMGPSLYFYLRQYHLQPSNTSAVLVTTIMSAAVLSILAVMYADPFYTDYGQSYGNLSGELQACTVMSLVVFTIVPSMRNLALESLKIGDSKGWTPRRWKMNPGTVLALLAVFAPFTFDIMFSVNDIMGFRVMIGSSAPVVFADGYSGWSLQPDSGYFVYRTGEFFALPNPGVLYVLVAIWMVRSALKYVQSDNYRRSFRLSVVLGFLLSLLPLIMNTSIWAWSPPPAQTPFPLLAVISILWARRMRSMAVRDTAQGVDIAGSSYVSRGMGPAIDETRDSQARIARVPVYYVVMSRLKRRKRRGEWTT